VTHPRLGDREFGLPRHGRQRGGLAGLVRERQHGLAHRRAVGRLQWPGGRRARSAAPIGIAQGALDDIIDIAGNKVPAMSRSKLAADPVAQYMVGSLATDLHMARTLLHEVARADQASVAIGPPDNAATLIRRARLARAAAVAASVVDGCYNLSGTTGLFESCPLQRRLRDARAVTQHFLLSVRSAFGPVGAALLSDGPAR
jgi:indole-3-acetate monooxygenase